MYGGSVAILTKEPIVNSGDMIFQYFDDQGEGARGAAAGGDADEDFRGGAYS